ncbi:carboxypeptidase-like regulatory domain-containing protein [Kolteria novifilia]|uniref:carboxypeptidase-like regulatory domain-containing protein n=1 Tax=Kolteria novifilia TaxID=2527975 RepID=UPI003AF34A7C
METMRVGRRVSLALVCLATSQLIGCGSEVASAAKPYPVAGLVTVQGKPLDNAHVMFVSLEGTEAGHMGQTDREGKFEMSAVPEGEYRVQIERQANNAMPDPRYAPYGAKSPLRAKVGEGTTNFTFDLDIAKK